MALLPKSLTLMRRRPMATSSLTDIILLEATTSERLLPSTALLLKSLTLMPKRLMPTSSLTDITSLEATTSEKQSPSMAQHLKNHTHTLKRPTPKNSPRALVTQSSSERPSRPTVLLSKTPTNSPKRSLAVDLLMVTISLAVRLLERMLL